MKCDADRMSDGFSDCIGKTTGFLPQCIQRVAGAEMTGALNFTFPGSLRAGRRAGRKRTGGGEPPPGKESSHNRTAD
ncbi:MAG: hypothetical protein CVU57_08145 [Deltaproteobacteria bacterium HGW-Deltaproteobacteria-15]|nr:MAG: hypothetical protein CVU57_08145 [Deltaproteobacteria bacterium HGW-Deltaproteobacteria-15]